MEQLKPKFTFFQLSSINIENINWSNLLIIHSERLLYLIFYVFIRKCTIFLR